MSSDVRVRLPSGARMESEPARVLGLAANECAPAGVGFDCSALRRMDDEAAGRQPPPRKRVGEETRWGSGPPSSDMGNYPTGEGDRLIRGRRVVGNPGVEPGVTAYQTVPFTRWVVAHVG